MSAMADPDPLEASVVGGVSPPRDPPRAPEPPPPAAKPLAPAAAGRDHAVSVSPYAGLASRTLAFGIDAGIINGVTFLTGVIVGAGLSVLNVPEGIQSALFALGGLLAIVWTMGYFVFFWSASGETPGNRLLDIKVQVAGENRPPSPRRAFFRALLLPLSAIPLCAGFLLILVDRRRRALHDCLAGTVVGYTD
jgi:uncharacterized RDD family membrane protein YckC